MAKNYKQSLALLRRCFRPDKTISTQIPMSNTDMTSTTSLSNICPLSSVIEAIKTIDQLVQSSENSVDKQQGDSDCIQTTMNIEQIEEMLIKWTHIARFLVDAYQQVQTRNEHQ
jgi:hypothetical protein